jgi:predicted RNA-binding Zn-ribbon protein involved in translation (DUF1610 family)
MGNDVGDEEVEIICPDCGYHLARSAARLRRDTPIVCPNCGREIAEPGEPETASGASDIKARYFSE